MSEETGEVRIMVNEVKQPPHLAVECPAKPLADDLSDPEHQRAVNAVFAQDHDEPSDAGGYLAMWAGALLVKEKKVEDTDDDERKKKLKRDGDCC